jgi:hypothetical protein
MIPGLKSGWLWLIRRPVPQQFVALLAIGLTLIVGPLGCRLLCPDDCCSDNSDCPICIFAHTQAAPPANPVIIAAQVPGPLVRPSLRKSEPRPAEDHQLLPSRAPPTLFSSLLLH